MKKIKVGVIGLGVGWQHVASFRKNRLCEVIALCDSSNAKLRKVARHFPGVHLTHHAEELMKVPYLDAVSIATYDDDHYSQVMMSLKNNKHVFVEKPLCQTLFQLHLIKSSWNRKKGRIKLMSNLILRAAPLYLWLKHEIQRGAFGKIYGFDGDYLYGRIEKITKGWRKDVKSYSVMQGGGIHLIDLMLWLTGERPTRVSSVGNRICTKNTAFRYNDFVASVFEFPSGLVARITANFGCVHKHQHVIRIFGTKKTFIYDDAGARVYSTRNPSQSPQKIRLSALAKSKGDLIPAFVKSIVKKHSLDQETKIIFDGIEISAAAELALKRGLKMDISYS